MEESKWLPLKPTFKSLKVNWIKRLKFLRQWVNICFSSLPFQLRSRDILDYDLRFNRHLQNTLFNHFWKNVFAHWIDFKCNYLSNLPLSNDNILTQSLWFNDNITVNNSSVWYKAWDKKGVRFVNDLLNVDGQFLSFIDFKKRCSINIDF